MSVPITSPDFHAAIRWLARHLAVLQVRRESGKVDELERRMREAESFSTIDAQLAGLLTIAVSEGFTPDGEA